MIRKATVPLIFTIAATLALLMTMLLTPVSGHNFDGNPTPTATSGVTIDSGASGGGNTGG